MNHLQCFRGHHHHHHHPQHVQTPHLSPSPVRPQQSLGSVESSLSITMTPIATTDYYQHSLYSSCTNDGSSRLSSANLGLENGSNNLWRQQQPLSLSDTHLSPNDSQYSLLASSASGALDGSGSSSGACNWSDELEEDFDFEHVSFDGAEIHRFQALEIAKEKDGKDGQSVKPKKKREKKRRTSKSSYKHVPHREKPVHLVARRNARERKRVQAVNSAFVRLRKVVPVENRGKRLSKVKTLHRAIQYIDELTRILEEENSGSSGGGSVVGHDDDDCHKTILSTNSSTVDIKSRKQRMLISSAVDSCSSEQKQQQQQKQQPQSSLAVIDQSDAVGHFLEGPIFNEYQHHHHHPHPHHHHPEQAPTSLMTSSSSSSSISGALLTKRHQQQHHQLQQQHQTTLNTFSFGSSVS